MTPPCEEVCQSTRVLLMKILSGVRAAKSGEPFFRAGQITTLVMLHNRVQ